MGEKIWDESNMCFPYNFERIHGAAMMNHMHVLYMRTATMAKSSAAILSGRR